MQRVVVVHRLVQVALPPETPESRAAALLGAVVGACFKTHTELERLLAEHRELRARLGETPRWRTCVLTSSVDRAPCVGYWGAHPSHPFAPEGVAMSPTILSEPIWRFTAGYAPADASTVAAVHVRDALSDLYSATLVLALTPGGEALDGLVGERALLETHRGDVAHRFQGIVRSVEDLGTTASHRFASVEVVPALWLLSQRSDVRIFQERNVVDVIRAVLRDAGVYQGVGALRVDASLEAMVPREYLVQYGETDLDFVRRLLEDEGIPFRFDHAGEGGEALVLAGDEHAWPEVATRDGGPVRVLDEGLATGTAESVGWFDERHEVRTTGVTVRDYDFTRPRASLDMTGRHGSLAGRLRRYEYPARASIARYDAATSTYGAHDTARLARVRTEEHLCRVHVGRGRSNIAGMVAGTTVTLAGHERPDLDARYLVTEVVHTGSGWHALPESLRGARG